jgi:thymidine phosphorylase
MITWQGGDAAVVDDPGRLPQARHVHHLKAQTSGFVQSLDALLVGRTAVALGAGRDKKGDAVDLSAGIVLHRKPGEAVTAGDSIMELHYNDASRLTAALALATQAPVISDRPPAEAPLLLGWVHDSGEQMFVAL